MPYDDYDDDASDDWQDDDDPWDDASPGYRPPSRAGTASLALGAVAGLMLATFSPLIVAANSSVVGQLVASAVGLASVAGLILAIGALRQRNVKRTFAVIGLVVNLGILIIIFTLTGF